MSLATSCVQRLSFQFGINGFFYSSFKPSVLSGQDVPIVVLKGMIFLPQISLTTL